ncbi:hypothetical protein E4U42_001340, partial [Claviceps africana]
IRDYEPCASLVIPPGKLSAFYTRYRLQREPFPLDALFDVDSRHGLGSLERLYQDLSCEYHLVPDRRHHSTRPSVPALTPTGLETWLTLLIRASPASESLRLSRLLLDVPLETDPSPSPSSPRATPERLPAQLSRSLLPAHRNEPIYTAVASALDAWHARASTAHRIPWTTLLYDALGGGSGGVSFSPPRKTKSHREPLALPAPGTIRPRRGTMAARSPEDALGDSRTESYRFFQGRRTGRTGGSGDGGLGWCGAG